MEKVNLVSFKKPDSLFIRNCMRDYILFMKLYKADKKEMIQKAQNILDKMMNIDLEPTVSEDYENCD